MRLGAKKVFTSVTMVSSKGARKIVTTVTSF